MLLKMIFAGLLVVAASSPAAAQSAAFLEGLSSRTAFETWRNSLSPDARLGADYWAGQRSLQRPGSCQQDGKSSDWINACDLAKTMLDPTDSKRRSVPEYRAGWNSYGRAAPSEVSATPRPTRPAYDGRQEAAARDCRVPLQRYPTYDFFGRVSGYRVAELPLDVQQQADECERQKQNAIRSLANERQAEAEAAQREAAQRLKDQQLARERSPDNVCATPNMARAVMLEFDGMEGFQNRGIKAIDVEHMVTRSPPGSEFPSCHGVFVTNRGLRLEGTLSLRQNIAGDAIASWRMEP